MNWAAHIAIAVIGLGLLILVFALLRRPRRAQPRTVSVLAAASIFLTASPLVSIWIATLIVDKAEKIASDGEYCIQVAESGGDYRPATGLVDLSPLTMHAAVSDGVTLQYRALLIVGRGASLQIYNWSHRSLEFDKGVALWKRAPIGGPVIRCFPRTHFAAALPLVGSSKEPLRYVRLDNYEFFIPEEYQPSPHAGSYPTIMISAVAPEFAPRQQPNGRRDFRGLVEIQLIPMMPLEKYSKMEGKDVLQKAEEFGLRKAVYGSAGDATSIVYSRAFNGEMQTLIVCGAPKVEPVLCQHYFLHDGLQYTFFHASNVVKEWSAMQSSLTVLMQNWRAGASNR